MCGRDEWLARKEWVKITGSEVYDRLCIDS